MAAQFSESAGKEKRSYASSKTDVKFKKRKMRLWIGQLVESLLLRIQNVLQLQKRDIHQRYLLFTFWIDFLSLFAPFSARRFCVIFHLQFLGAPASIWPRVRCSAGAADGHEVLARTGAVTDCKGRKFIKILLIVVCSDMTIETRYSILEGSFQPDFIFFAEIYWLYVL